MAQVSNGKNGQSRFSLFRRAPKAREISGYHIGDIQEEERPVIILADANLSGNIFAPKVTIIGLLYGSIVAQETIIKASGQVWGDVCTARLELEPKGKIQGWVSDLDDAAYQQAQRSERIPTQDNTPTPGPFELPGNQGAQRINSADQLDTLRRLQAETAASLAARAELEQSFNQRLTEVAGETSARATLLQDELAHVHSELDQLSQTHKDTKSTLAEREEQIKRQLNELEVSRELLSERKEQLDTLRNQHQQKTTDFDNLSNAKSEIDTELHEARQNIEKFNERVASLEGALQSSLQHSSEQEDALIRWQELAEVTEARVKELESEMESNKLQITESSRVTDMLREQRKQAEKAWQETKSKLAEAEGKLRNSERDLANANEANETLRAQRHEIEALWQEAKSELEQLRHVETRPLLSPEIEAQINQLADRLEQAKEHILLLQKREEQQRIQLAAVSHDRDTQIQQRETALASLIRERDGLKQELGQQQNSRATEQQEQLAALTKERDEAEDELQQYQERLLWNKASLETARAELNEAREQLEANIQELESLRAGAESTQTTLRQQAKQLEEQQANINTLTADLDETKQTVAEQTNNLSQQTAQLSQQSDELQAQSAQITEQSNQIEEQLTAINMLQQKLANTRSQASQWQGEADRLSEEVGNQEQILQAMQTQMEVVEQQAILDKENANKSVREMRSRLEAQDAEVNQYVEQANHQGQQLAELRTLIVERDIQLNELKATVKKQTQFIKQMKTVTTQHIQKLQNKLATSQQQVKDLTAVLQRRQNR